MKGHNREVKRSCMAWYGIAWHGAASSLVSYALPLTCVTDPIVYRASIIISPTHHGRQEVQGRANCVESAVSSQWHLWLSVECGFFSSSSLDTDTQHTQNEIVPSIEPHSRRLSSPLLVVIILCRGPCTPSPCMSKPSVRCRYRKSTL